MQKALKLLISIVFVLGLSGCLFYCMVAGAGAGAVAYVIMAAILSLVISVLLCAGFHYIRHLQKLLEKAYGKQDLM